MAPWVAVALVHLHAVMGVATAALSMVAYQTSQATVLALPATPL
jgi:hypothetical protein